MRLHLVRERTGILVAFGDCAVAGNVKVKNLSPELQKQLGYKLKEPEPPKGLRDAWDKLPLLKQVLNMAPKVVSSAPCQEVVIEKPNNVYDYLVPIRHTELEKEMTVGSGIRCLSGKMFDGGTDVTLLECVSRCFSGFAFSRTAAPAVER